MWRAFGVLGFWGGRLLRESPQAARRRQPVTRHRVAGSREITVRLPDLLEHLRNGDTVGVGSRFLASPNQPAWERCKMIHHVSIPAREPRHVAEVLAELMGGKCHPFGPLEGAFMATSGDEHGTMIEVYPERATLDIPASDDQVVFGENKAPPNTWPFHVLLSVPLEPNEIERIGAREGWRAKIFGRGMQGQKPFFHVIEFWLENRLMIEVVSPAMAQEYQDFLKNAQLSVMNDPESLRQMRATHIKEPA